MVGTRLVGGMGGAASGKHGNYEEGRRGGGWTPGPLHRLAQGCLTSEPAGKAGVSCLLLPPYCSSVSVLTM